MPQVVESMPSGRKLGQSYDWKSLFDGQTWKLDHGSDFSCKMSSFRCQVFSAAKKYAVKVSTRVEGDSLYLQAFDLDGNPISKDEPKKSKRA
jgi:hypothetical protein